MLLTSLWCFFFDYFYFTFDLNKDVFCSLKKQNLSVSAPVFLNFMANKTLVLLLLGFAVPLCCPFISVMRFDFLGLCNNYLKH